MYFTIALILVTIFVSYKGFKNDFFLQKYAFSIDKISVYKEYKTLITSGFLHVNWLHLGINMFVLWAFGSGLETSLGVLPYLLIYFSSLAGGNILALWIHKHNSAYTSVGASGAISGLIFATIALYPGLRILFIPGWVYGVAYVLYTIYAIRSKRTDVGHAAHLGGALIGMTVALLMFPAVLNTNWLPVLGILLPGVALIIIMIKKPELILIDKKTQRRQLTMEDRYNLKHREAHDEVDRILEKISRKGMNSLTSKEKEALEKYSKL